MRRVVFGIVIILFSASVLFASGNKETTDGSAKTLESWSETMDISSQKPGKYNILVTAEDEAGNKALAGPFNMYIDPDSDLPVARITNPLQDMRVPGNLNVVGTCLARNGVAYVELVFDGKGDPVRAEGKKFWSCYLDTHGLSDGPHTISVCGVDVNGLKGRPYQISWNLDRNRPEATVKNLAMGSLVTGKFHLSGQVSDGNGIKSLFYSLDSGKSFTPIALKNKKKELVSMFDLEIDTKKMHDGPAVCWFKAMDGQGSEGLYTFLYFVDNTKPEVGFITPDTGEPVHGVFSVAGYARDPIGIKTLSWKMGKDSGSFDLIKGNPYWIKEFDIRGQKLNSVEVEITAISIAGNKTVVVRKIPVNAKAEIPVIKVTSPTSGTIFDADVTLSGYASDGAALGEVWYTIDKAAPAKISSAGVFGILLSGNPAGKHTLEVWPVGVNGIRGASAFIPFEIMGAAPAIQIDPVPSELSELNSEAGASLSAAVTSTAGLKEIRYTITGMAEKTVPIKPGTLSANLKIPVTPDFPYGLVSLEIRATDIHDHATLSTQNFYVTNLGIPRGSPSAFSDEKLTASGDVTIPASGKTPVGTGKATVTIERLLPDDAAFRNGMSVTLAGPGAQKASQKDAAVRLGIDSPVPVSEVTWNLNGGAPIKIGAQKTAENRYEALVPLKFSLPADWTTVNATVTFKDTTALSVSGVVCIVRPAPAAGIYDDEQFAWGNVAKNDTGNILLFDGAAASGMYNGKTNLKAEDVFFVKPADGLSVSLAGNTITVTGTKEGTYSGVSLAIIDSEGSKFTTVPVTFVVDNGVPALSVDTSERPVWIQNILPVKGKAIDTNGVVKVEYSFDNGTTWKAFSGAIFDQKLDVSALPDGKVELLVRATDKVGRTATDWRVLTKDTKPPAIETIVPAPGDEVNGETTIAFRFNDASPVISAEYRAPGDRTAKDKSVWLPLTLSSLTNTVIGTATQPISDKMEFRFTDAAGNSTSTSSGSWLFSINPKADLPVVEIHLPAENEVIQKDFVVSGVAYDDDQPAKVWYKIDNGPLASVDIEHSFSIPVALSSLTDNEHTITVFAEDIYGVRGEEVVRKIRVSLEEPKAEVRTPSYETTNKGLISLTGVASDKNGISKVEVSLDNGNTFDLADGTEQWSYRFDSRVIEDGTHVVFVRVYDKYGITGLYSSLVNIDNTAPALKLELPLDGSRSGETLFVSGQAMDNIGLERLAAKISNLDPKQPAVPPALAEIVFKNELIIGHSLDIRSLPEGFYNLEVRGFDHAGNVSRVSRNFEVFRGKDRNRIEFLYPLNGEKTQGVFNLYGRVISEDPVNSLMLYIDDVESGSTELTPSGYFKFTVTPEMISDGTHKLSVRALVSDSKVITSDDHSVIYKSDGPWVAIDNFAMGDFAIDRPWLLGTAGYSLTEEDVLALKSKDTSKEARRQLQLKSLQKVEISFDNGKTFVKTESGKKWRYRIETGDLPEGYHFLIVRATMNNGEIAISRSIIQIDKTNPSIKLISPGEGGRYNNDLVFSGLSSDDVKLNSVKFSLRPGDKSAYAVPAFIQGLYFDWHFWGATLYDVGIGLTFFNDNVKVQCQFGQFTDAQRAVFTPKTMRYGGNVFGLKMLANLAYVPMDYFFGPDFAWLSATGAIGANFSVFTQTQSGKPQILSALLGQIEFPRVTLPKQKYFRTFSLYTEMQLWFIPTDVSSTDANIQSILPHITGGIRLNVF